MSSKRQKEEEYRSDEDEDFVPNGTIALFTLRMLMVSVQAHPSLCHKPSNTPSLAANDVEDEQEIYMDQNEEEIPRSEPGKKSKKTIQKPAIVGRVKYVISPVSLHFSVPLNA